MKLSAETKSRLSDYLELTKPRICVMALIMATLGFFLGLEGPLPWGLFVASLVGIGLVGAGCGALNQFIERDFDAQMWRTLNRPLPAGRLAPERALYFGIVLATIGTIILFVWVNNVTAWAGLFTLFFYVCVYTPSKRLSSLSTLLGAVPGAMPPLLGWTASQGTIGPAGLILFGILFLWQVPHFLAIAWIYRDDYGRANFPILTVIDKEGRVTAHQIVLYSVLLVPLTLLPSAWGVTGALYGAGALVLGLLFLVQAIALAVYRTKLQARRLFFASLIYLPALSVLMIVDRVH